MAKDDTYQRKLQKKKYKNGQLALFVQDDNGEPIAELSIMHESVELAQNEFILKDYSENESLVVVFFESHLIYPTNRFVLIGSHLCPICQIET